jgi:Family of unknown function (DUF6535)
MLQQWARRYLTITQPPRYSPHRRASIRAFFANGIEKFHLPWSVEALPAMLHLSLFLFFTGLVIYLFNINHTVFSVVVWWVGVAGGVYGCITLMPIFWLDSPYYSPLSSSVWLFLNFTFSAIRRIRFFLLAHRWPHFEQYLLFEGLTKIVQEAGSELSAEINNHILTWTIHAMEEDKDLEHFFEAIPGFCSSEEVQAHHLELDFTKFDKPLARVFYEFIYRTSSSSLFLEEDKKRRVVICAKAADAANLTHTARYSLRSVFNHGVDLLRSVDIWQTLRSSSDDQVSGLCSQGIIAGVVASVSERDERWEALAMDQLGEAMFQKYKAHGDSVLLANLIHITRPLFRLCLGDRGNLFPTLSLKAILQCISKFDIVNTLPGLQHDFCDLWNEITREAQSHRLSEIPFDCLKPIRHLYIALHQGTYALPTAFNASTNDDDPVLYDPFSYPLCNITGHHSDSSSAGPPTITSPPVNPRGQFVGESSPRDVLDATPTIPESSHLSPPINVETSHPAATRQGLTDTAPTISPISNSESYPHPAPAVSIPIPHPSFSLPSTSSNVPDPQNDAGLGVVPDVPLSSSSGPVASDNPFPFVTSMSPDIAPSSGDIDHPE